MILVLIIDNYKCENMEGCKLKEREVL
uniref:Uncharacterized protein n=1 Tax=Anguilla anguilla TaxID=7936 RepID=A0A0E9UR12_ANGAN